MNAPFFVHTAEAESAAEPAGMLFVMRCMPDMFTGERLNVGVCAFDKSGRRLAKVITEPGRLTCLYGDASKNVVLMAEVGRDAFLAGHSSPSSQLVFDEPLPFFNSTLEDAVHNTFADQVTVALPQRTAQPRTRLTDDDAFKKVSEIIKARKGLDANVLANTPQVLINTDRGTRPVYIPLQPIGGVGTVRSAFYDPATVKVHLMDSVLDLECASRYRNKKQQGLFILRPSKGSEEKQALIDAAIDNVAFRSPKDMRIEVRTSPEELAQDILDWAEA